MCQRDSVQVHWRHRFVTSRTEPSRASSTASGCRQWVTSRRPTFIYARSRNSWRTSLHRHRSNCSKSRCVDRARPTTSASVCLTACSRRESMSAPLGRVDRLLAPSNRTTDCFRFEQHIRDPSLNALIIIATSADHGWKISMKLTLCVESLVSPENKTKLNVKYCNRA